MKSDFAVEFHDVVKIFPTPEGGTVTAVDHVSLEIKHGEFFSFLGPSGCGKTTSLRMMAGFEWPTSGEVIIDGKVMGRIPPYLRPVNTVFQSYALFQHMNVFQNIAFGLEMEKVPKAEINRRVGEALEMVKLGSMGRRTPKQLSGGQQQRIALARALVKRPEVLLLDEPLGALDLKLRKEMQLELKALQEQVGITFIYVTHDQEEALTMSNRIAVMSKGRTLQIGGAVEIYERPNCRFVADFIGETNFLTGTIKALTKDRVTVLLNSLNQEISGIGQGDLSVGQAVAVSIRPEKVRLVDEDKKKVKELQGTENQLHGKVVTTAYIGSDTRVVLDLGGGLRMRAWEQNAISTLDPDAYYTAGDAVRIYIPIENTLVLPEDVS
ncbi:MAG: ABC transporter ATP-binding protein [Anaerolineales bacterium]|jgi:spermidine/putrescine transport system ATP-binding protein